MTDIETAIMIKNMAREAVKKATVKNADYSSRGLPRGWKLEEEKGKRGKYILTDPDGEVTKFHMLPDDIIAWAKKQQKMIDDYEREKGQKQDSYFQRMADEHAKKKGKL